MRTTTVWRLENVEGLGPYSAGASAGAGPKGSRPLQDFDIPAREQAAWFEKRRGWRFAFPDVEAAIEWFGLKRLQKLEEKGFYLVPKEAKKVEYSNSGLQVIYLPVDEDFALSSGETAEDFKRSVEKSLQKEGWDPVDIRFMSMWALADLCRDSPEKWPYDKSLLTRYLRDLKKHQAPGESWRQAWDKDYASKPSRARRTPASVWKKRKNPTDTRLFNSLKVFDRLPPDEREGLRLALIEIVFNSVGIDHYDRDATSDELLAEYSTDDRLTGKSVIDGCVPWLAQRLAKERFQNQREADATLDALKRRFRKLCTWATETRQNLASFSIQEALAESKNHQSFAQKKGKEESDVNPTLYRFSDGWKVVELRTDKALELEGKVMDHCVGNYCKKVAKGESRIFSLRDSENKPHITMEYQPEKGRFKQIFGPANAVPSEYTHPYIKEFIEELFDRDVRALLLAKIPAKDLNLVSADLEDANLPTENLQGVNLKRVNLQRAVLYKANLKGAKLQGANLRGANLRGANLQGAHLRGANLYKAGLFGADLREAKLQRANLQGAELLGAKLQRADLRGADFEGADLDFAELRGAKYNDDTTWPEFFDPEEAGAINVG